MERSDVFISYRRKDVDFVKQLDAALKNSGREVWVDWEDIPPGLAGFTDEIVRGIEGADALIAVLSPDYLESEYCLMELKHAVDLKKRIVPVVYRKFDEYPVPEGIGHINWVYFCPHAGQSNTFAESFPKVIAALETDFEHMRTHTRLLLRAREWEQKQKHGSLLLFGQDLSAAEAWLTAGVGKQPAPIPLHADFIAASRQAATRRQRVYTVIASVVAVILLVLSAFAVTQWVSAQQNYETAQANLARAVSAEETAVFQRDEAESVALAAQAELELSGLQSERAVLLALAALADYPYTANAERALAQAVHAHRLRDIYAGGFVSVSPDQTRLMLYGDDGLLHVLEVASGEELFTFQTAPLPQGIEQPQGAWLRYYGAWSPDAKYMLAATPDDLLMLYDNASGEAITPIPVSGGDAGSALWSPDSALFSTLDGENLSVWEASSGQKLATLPVPVDAVWRGVWSPDSTRLAVASLLSTNLGVWEARTGRLSAEANVSAANLVGYNWSADGKTLVLHSFTGESPMFTLQVIDAVTGRDADADPLTRAPAANLSMSPDGSHLAVATGSREREQGQFVVQVWNTARWEMVAEFDPLTAIGSDAVIEPNLYWSPDGGQVAFGLNAGTRGLYVWFPREGQGVLLDGATFPIIWSPDGTRAVTFDEGVRAFTVWDTATGDKLASLGGQGEDAQALWSPDGQFVMTVGSDRTARLWEPETGVNRFTFSMTNVPELAILSQGDQSRLTAIDVAGVVRAWDVSEDDTLDAAGEGESTRRLSPGLQLSNPVWSPDGSKVIVSNGDLSATVWAVLSGANQALFTLAPLSDSLLCPNCPPQADYILDAAWSPDGTRIATAQFGEISNFGLESDSRTNFLSGSNGSLRIWDAASGAELLRLEGGEGSLSFTSVAWSPDGTRVAAGVQGYTPQFGEQADHVLPRILIWDSATGNLLLTLEGHEGQQIGSLAWSHDGTRLVSAGDDGTARVWESATGSLLLTFAEHQHWVVSAAWSPDDRQIVTAAWDNRILVWNADTGEVTTRFSRHTDWPNSAEWSPNGERIVSASWDKTALVWEAATGNVVDTLEGHEDAVLGAAWSPDGRHIVTVSRDDTARLWQAWQTLDDLKAEAAQCCVVRELTPDERALFGLAGE